MIKIKNLNKQFVHLNSDDSYALKNINLNIKKSEFVVIEGISGSGKSTLLSIIGAIMKPTSGAVLVEEENIVSYSDFHASYYRLNQVGFITQSFHLFDELSVKDNILATLALTNLSKKEIETKIQYAMKLSNINHKQTQKVSTLSGGEKQRCIIARALVNNPQIILCDEPTANLDKENTLRFIKILQDLKSLGKTIIVATHDPIFKDLNFVDTYLSMRNGTLE